MTVFDRTRFAPSPTGFLHLGHVASALHARDHAGSAGDFLIRIEDIDRTRCLESFTRAAMEDLAWLGFESAGAVRVQSCHMAAYRGVLAGLRGRGLVYPCYCTRAEIAARASLRAPDGSVVYPGTCRGGGVCGEGRSPAWRLDMGRALAAVGELGWQEEGRGFVPGEAALFGDVVLGRRDSGVSYHLCVTHDDMVQGIGLVTRGMDLFTATSVHRVLQALMGWPEPRYAHHGLLLGEDGRKLSKRDGAEGVRVLRARGVGAGEVLGMARRALARV